MRIFLVRHATHSLLGRVLCGRTIDIRLDAEGVWQTRALAAWFANEPVDLVQTSPRRRARETAEPIASRFGLTAETVPALDEHDAGEWTGADFETLARDERWRAWNERRGSVRPPAGGSMRELQARVLHHIEDVRSRKFGSAIMMSHAEPIRAALMHYRHIALDDFHRVHVEPASIHMWDLGRDSVEVHNISLMAMA
jgi:broad specificity phosphatase PhoE